jgi:hypothetical protein
MKKVLSTLLLLCLFTFSKAQNCITVNHALFTNPSGDNIHWVLTINWSADGTKHLSTTVTNYGDTVLNECLQVSNGGGGTLTGTTIYNIVIPNGHVNFIGKFRRFTGTCGNGTECDAAQSLINNILPIYITDVTARNVGINTEIRFTIQSIKDDDNIVTLNMVLKNGTKRQYKIQMPNDVRVGQVWKIVIDNKTQKYTLIKI